MLYQISCTGLSPSLAGFPKTVLLSSKVTCAVRTPRCTHHGLGSARFARRYFGHRCFFLFLRLLSTSGIDVSFFSSGYLDVSVHRVPLRTLWIGVRIHEVRSCGFPHSEICGSMDMCSSPQLFAAYHVFHRLLVPRHPPCALLRFIFLPISRRSAPVHSVAPAHGSFSVFLGCLVDQ